MVYNRPSSRVQPKPCPRSQSSFARGKLQLHQALCHPYQGKGLVRSRRRVASLNRLIDGPEIHRERLITASADSPRHDSRADDEKNNPGIFARANHHPSRQISLRFARRLPPAESFRPGLPATRRRDNSEAILLRNSSPPPTVSIVVVRSNGRAFSTLADQFSYFFLFTSWSASPSAFTKFFPSIVDVTPTEF